MQSGRHSMLFFGLALVFTCFIIGGMSQITDIRLVDGTNQLNGRLEVEYDGIWGTVCDDYFDEKDARVACAHLNYPNPAAIAYDRAHFGEGTGQINLDNVNCAGTEASLDECASIDHSSHNCQHSEDVGVDCEFSPDASSVFVRLVGGSTANEGRVEVIYQNVIGTICDNEWDDSDAEVICYMLGYQKTGSQAAAGGTFGEGEDTIWVDKVNCLGNEDFVYNCPTINGWNIHTCSHANDAGVICSIETHPENFILVTDSTHDNIYRMDLSTFAQTEINHDNTLQPIAIGYDPINQKIYWSDLHSEQLKKSNLDGSNFVIFAQLPSGATPDGLAIDPISRNLFFTDTGTHTISVTSLDDYALKPIVTGLDKPRGIALHPNKGYIFWTDWGTVCKIERANMDGTGRTSLIGSGIKEPSGIAIDYSAERIYWTDLYADEIQSADFDGQNRERIYIGTGRAFGLVLVGDYIYYTDWDERTIMRINKDGNGKTGVGPATFGHLNQITAYTSADEIYTLSPDHHCTEHVCSHMCVPMPEGESVCLCPGNMVLDQDGNTCVIDPDIRLVGGATLQQGRLEVRYNGIWGTVCDDSFDEMDARVACASLGFPNPWAIAYGSAHFGGGSGRINFDDLICDGTEPSLHDCPAHHYPNENCDHNEDAGVDCEFSPDAFSMFVRLVGGSTANEGRVEVIYRNVIGTICGNDWGDSDAEVICSMLGYQRTGSHATAKGAFSEGEGTIWVDEVNCDGSEDLIYDCPTINGWRVHTCSHADDAGVICSTETHPDNFILVTDSSHDNIYRMDLSTFAQTEINHDDHLTPKAIGYDHINQKIYWSDVQSDQLKKSNLDGSNFEIITDLPAGSTPDGLAIDSISGNLFFTDRGTHIIGVTSLEVYALKSLFWDLDKPRGIALHPDKGYIFWTDWGTDPMIERANMDGTGRLTLIDSDIQRPNGITIDSSAEWIYWADAHTDTIEKVDFDGQNRETIYTGTGYMFGLVLVDDYIYYTDWEESTIMRINKEGEGETGVGPATFGRLNAITAYTSADAIYALRANGCTENECSHICVPMPAGEIACLCPDNMELNENGNTCVISPDIRLVGGTDLQGRLEVKYNGIWGTVCDDNFDEMDARVACASLGLPNPAAIAYGSAHFGEGGSTERINFDDLNCAGNEPSLHYCPATHYPYHNCQHSEDAGVDCEFAPDASSVFVRLVGGSTANEGRVEVIYRNVIGTICGNDWDDSDAEVICSMLGYQRTGSQATARGAFLEGEGPIWVDEVNCDGNEDLIYDCPTINGWNVHTCSHADDAGVICSTETHPDNFILMTDSSHDHIYRMDISTFAQTEINHNGHLQPIAIGYDHINQKMYWSDIQSHQLKKSSLDGSNVEIVADLPSAMPDGLAIDPISRNLFFTDRGTHTIGVINLQSYALKSILRDLEYPRGIALHPDKGYVFWIDKGTTAMIERANMDGTGRIPLIISGIERPSGIAIDYSVERIYWTDTSTDKIEKADFDGQNRETIYTGTGIMFGLVLVDDYIYYTNWYESSVMRMRKNGEGNTRVGPSTFGRLNEITAYTSDEGIYALLPNGCTENECSHICVPMPAGEIACLCPDNMELNENGNTCVIGPDIRLVGGTDLQGRLEVKYNGIWGTVCDDDFDEMDARVACASLGLPNPAAMAYGSAHFGAGGFTERINFDDLNCAGNEPSLHHCPATHYPYHNCQHSEDAGVDCEFAPDASSVFVRLVGGSTANEGRVEVIYRNVIGTICGNDWDDSDAEVICSMLGYQRTGSQATARGAFLEGEGPIWVDEVNCDGNEDLIYDCPTINGWNVHTCSHADDAGVICSTETHPDNFILMTDSSHDHIYRMDISTFAHTEINHNGHLQPIAIGYDHINQKMYWSDIQSHQLKKSSLDGSNFEIVADLPSAMPDGLAIDPISRNLFFTDRGTHTIGVINLQSYALKSILRDLEYPRGIALHPDKGYVFWIDKGTTAMIERANMDGTGRIPLIISGIRRPSGIAIDYSVERIYWTDTYTDKIEKADFDGQNRETIYTGTGIMFGLVLVDDYIYYTNWYESSVMRMRKNGEGNTRVGPSTFGRLNEITAYTSDEGIYALLPNGCTEQLGGCSHICVPMPEGAIACLCPDGMRLEDLTNCLSL